MNLSMISFSCVIVLLTICTLTMTEAIERLPRLVPLEDSPLSIRSNYTNPSVVSLSSTALLDAATKSLNNSGKPRTPHTEITIAAAAILMMLILGIDKTLNKSDKTLNKSDKTLNKSCQESTPQAPTSRAALPNEAEQGASSQASVRQPRSIGGRSKKPFPNVASCCPIPAILNTNNTWSDPMTGEVFTIPQDRPTSRTGRKCVAFADVHVRELEWEPDKTCCEHGIPQTWLCTIGAHYSFSVESAELNRQTTGRLHKQEYCWTSHKRGGPKLECECCQPPSESPPAPPPSSPEKKALVENEICSLGCPDNIVAPNSHAKTVTEMYLKEKLRFFS